MLTQTYQLTKNKLSARAQGASRGRRFLFTIYIIKSYQRVLYSIVLKELSLLSILCLYKNCVHYKEFVKLKIRRIETKIIYNPNSHS